MTEFVGRTVTEATEEGLATLGLTIDDVDVEILDEGRGGVFGLGSDPRGCVSPGAGSDEEIIPPELDREETMENHASPAPDDNSPPPIVAASVTADKETESSDTASYDPQGLLALSQQLLQGLLDHMGLETKVEATVAAIGETDEPMYLLNIAGEDLGVLIGRRGETLDAIQYLVRLMVNHRTHTWPHIEVDVEHYMQRRELTLQRLAQSMAERAVNSGRTVVLEAMPARERRIIHVTLQGREDVDTQSIGEGENRKVTIIPR